MTDIAQKSVILAEVAAKDWDAPEAISLYSRLCRAMNAEGDRSQATELLALAILVRHFCQQSATPQITAQVISGALYLTANQVELEFEPERQH
jgi:hypothetical protein